MGISFRAYAVIGVEIDIEKLYGPEKKVKTFEHDYPESVKFDPETGKKLWDTIRDPIPEYDEFDKLGDYTIYSDGASNSRHIVGIGCEDSSGYCRDSSKRTMPLDDLEEKVIELRAFLDRLGLLKDKDTEVELHALAYVSC